MAKNAKKTVRLKMEVTIRGEDRCISEVRINGKGVVNDAIRRPFILYRLLMGLLPF